MGNVSSAETGLLAIDQGTSSSRAILFSPAGEILTSAQKDLTLSYPQKGWVEQNPKAIWADTLEVCRQVLKDVPQIKIAGLGITNQRETTIIWDRKTGAPVYHAIVWQDRRTAEICETLKSQGHEPSIQDKTGLLLDPYFSATKIAWILDNVDGARARAQAGELAFGTVECFLLWHLTAGQSHLSDATNAARTMLFNIKTQGWDDDLLALFDIPKSLLPEVRDNVSDFGITDQGLLGQEIPIGAMAGDQQAALIGQGCLSPGMVKSTYGTGCFMLMNIGCEFIPSQHRLLTTNAYRLNGEVSYALEGSVFIAGAAIAWLRDNLGLLENAAESEDIAQSVPDNNGVYFVPALAGLGAPYWLPDAQGMICGLTRESNKAHIIRATLEAQAYQSRDLIDAFIQDSGVTLGGLWVDGGLAGNGFMCQFLSEMLGVPVQVPKVIESTARGVAMLAGVQAGVYGGLDDAAAKTAQIAREYRPQMREETRAALYAGWKNAIDKLLR